MSWAGCGETNRIETPVRGPMESGKVCSVEVEEKIAKKIAKNKRCYANTLLPPLKDAVERR
jgi:hypothetical protein